MNVKQVTDALAEAFVSARIVFWNDAGKDFLSLFDGEMFSPVEGVSVIRLDQTPALQAKLRTKREEPETKFLLYSPTPEPEDPLDDWLFDIQLYARQFYADYTVTVLQDLGLTSLALRKHLGSRRKFLDLPWFAPPEILSLKVATFKGGRSRGGRSISSVSVGGGATATRFWPACVTQTTRKPKSSRRASGTSASRAVIRCAAGGLFHAAPRNDFTAPSLAPFGSRPVDVT